MFSKGKKSISISNLLWRNYIIIIITSIVLIVVPYIAMVVFSYVYKGRVIAYDYTASSIMRDSINEIKTEGIIKNKGSVDVIKKDGTVIHLGGKDTIGVKKFSIGELTDFFISAESKESEYHRDIAYNEKEGYWVVVTFPISLTINLVIQYNEISKDFRLLSFLVFVILCGYVFIIICSVILIARYTARAFIKPMRVLQEMTVQIEKENFKYVLESSEEFNIKEFTSYKEALKHMSLALKKQKNLTETISENRNNMVRDISHDLKNPLASIRGYSELCINNKDLPQQQREAYIECIYRNSIRANELITSLFEYSKINSNDFKITTTTVDICELVRSIVVEYISRIEEGKLLLEVDIPEEEIFIKADLIQMKRVFCNLLDNAIKYHFNGTTLTIRVQLDNAANVVLIQVKDNGIGMEESLIKHCFDPFTREDQVRNSKTGGSGLGLAIVKQIVVLHGGNITVDSQKNKGCNFLVQLPVSNLNPTSQ